jgi:hypothetical protein
MIPVTDEKNHPERLKPVPKTTSPDDMLDGEDIRQWEYPLGLVISYIHTSLYETYSEFDRDAINKQTKHKWFSFFAVFFGTLAIILAIIQVFFQSYTQSASFAVSPESIVLFEKGSFLTAVIAIAVAGGSRWHKDWLKKRYLAEQCRSLKFRALIHPFLSSPQDDAWPDRFSRWKKRFDENVSLLKKREDLSLGQILTEDKMNAPPHETQGALNIPYLVMLADYYQKKRISTQLEYYSLRAHSFTSVNTNTERIPEFCFVGGVVAAGVKFGIDVFASPLLAFIPDTFVWQFLSSLALLITLVLPCLGIAVRTLRSSVEVSRSALLFSAKYKALKQFDERLSDERARDSVNWVEILKIMWECENFFESENREWLRIMHDARWSL